MAIIVSRHVFGSDLGYKTLAKCASITQEEVAQLESFSFGQTNNASYLASLKDNPAYFMRRLSSDRWAVTRVIKGKADEYSRSTLLFITAIISKSDWLFVLQCDTQLLLDCRSIWEWNGQSDLPQIRLKTVNHSKKLSPTLRKKVLSLLAAVEIHIQDVDTTIVVSESDFSAPVFRLLNMLLPQDVKKTFSYAVRSLSDALPLTVVCMSNIGSSGNSSRRMIACTGNEMFENTIYTKTIAQFWQSGGDPPWQFIQSCASFVPEGLITPDPVLSRKPNGFTNRWVPAIGTSSRMLSSKGLKWFALAVLMTVVVGFVSILWFNKIRQAKEINLLVMKADHFLTQYPEGKGLPEEENARKDIIREPKQILGSIEALPRETDDRITNSRGNLQKWLQYAMGVDKKYKDIAQVITGYHSLNLSKPLIYPPPNDVQSVINVHDALKSGLRTMTDLGSTRYRAQIEKAIPFTAEWLKSLSSPLDDIKKRVTADVALCENKEPKSYSPEKHRFYLDRKFKIENFEKENSLINAAKSPIKEHNLLAQNLLKKLGEAGRDVKDMLIKLRAEKAFGTAKKILGDDPNYPQYVEALSHLQDACAKWPDKEIYSLKEEEVLVKIDKHLEGWESQKKEIGEKLKNAKDLKALKALEDIRNQINHLLGNMNISPNIPEAMREKQRSALQQQVGQLHNEVDEEIRQMNNSNEKTPSSP